ncbi:MAG: hypothetical protein WBA44_02895 [Mesorhizobium sp.]
MRSLASLAISSALLLMTPLPAAAETAPPAVEAQFSSFLDKFRAALKADDAGAIAAMTRLPFMAADNITNVDQFTDMIYEQDFTGENRSCLQTEAPVYERDGANNDNYFIFCGEMIFVFTLGPDGFQFTDIGVND